MFSVLNGVFAIFIYLALNHFIEFDWSIHCLFFASISVYFLVIYLFNKYPELLQKIINNMKKVK